MSTRSGDNTPVVKVELKRAIRLWSAPEAEAVAREIKG